MKFKPKKLYTIEEVKNLLQQQRRNCGIHIDNNGAALGYSKYCEEAPEPNIPVSQYSPCFILYLNTKKGRGVICKRFFNDFTLEFLNDTPAKTSKILTLIHQDLILNSLPFNHEYKTNDLITISIDVLSDENTLVTNDELDISSIPDKFKFNINIKHLLKNISNILLTPIRTDKLLESLNNK